MSFVEWYEETFKDMWHEDYGLLYSFANEMVIKYEKYCKENSIVPVWNG